ncbi:MAG: type III polyketide synthase [Balneolaceae bacterium]|nr:type III polyketide synthase [Balneolaceae bacterium]
MAAYINHISTGVPEHCYTQDFLRRRMREYVGTQEVTRRIIDRIYARSGIEKRHTVVRDFHANGNPRFFFRDDGTMERPSTGARNRRYVEHARPLYSRLARAALEEGEADPSGITHVITVSCTGFYAPEPAFHIIRDLGLPPSTQRFHVGFMGCFAAFPALRMARAFCEADPGARVLVVCLELCSLHFQGRDRTDNLISESVFADGGAAVLVEPEPRRPGPSFRLDRFRTDIADDSEGDMAWIIGDTGFDMVLSSAVPDILREHIRAAVAPLLDGEDLSPAQASRWAVHPGGRAILDKVEQEMGLAPEQIAASRSVLRDYGNMSSATILFVLKRLMEEPSGGEANRGRTLALAFGPGLTIESALLTRVGD